MEMPQTPNQAESTALHRIKARAREQEDSNSALVRFIGQFFAGVAPEDLAERTVDDLYGAVISQWRLLQRRKRGERLVRIINPHAQEHGWQSSHTIIEVVQDDMPFLVDSARPGRIREFAVRELLPYAFTLLRGRGMTTAKRTASLRARQNAVK